MLRVGLTGGIACGKSTVAKMFADLGVYVIQSDQVAHELYRPGEPVYAEVVRRFGNSIVKPGGEIDRAKLAAIAFGENRIEELNRIVHPAVIQHQSRWIFEVASKEPDAIAMIEAALIFEAGTNTRFEKMVVVTCTPEQKVVRFARRAGIDETAARAEVERRSKAQWSDEEKIKRADYVLDNSGSVEQTQAQVKKLFAEFKALAQK
ncbi:MAG TPA: dephospho-CoA kinase [Candidatus Angelobacter sp.]|jgi:dephospho-CoA kinase|nr:dephospho-CoA kinase [Candidatus Angelobacter sp.]